MKNNLKPSTFNQTFNSRQKCLKHLCNLKWGGGFTCRYCSHNMHIKGKTWYYRKCQRCKKEESCTSHTLFHKVKIPLPVAFDMIYRISGSKKGISCSEICRIHKITRKTAYEFRRKVQAALLDCSLESFHSVFQTLNKHENSYKKNVKKKIIVTVNCSCITNRKSAITSISSNFKVDQQLSWAKALWTPISSGKSKRKKSKLGFKVEVRLIQGDQHQPTKLYIYRLRNWLGGLHHIVSLAYLQSYLDEFQYRYDQRGTLSDNPWKLLRKFTSKAPLTIKSQ